MLEIKPQIPTQNTSTGFETFCGSTNRCMASRKMVTQRATKKTPLIRAPNVSARCHFVLISSRDVKSEPIIRIYSRHTYTS